ncbi:MAG: DNA translocase FtsK [Lachnospiraceae bacterium]|nr:DNA translocase FtsK [Lachnospiraceae bacterium]
MTSKNTGAKKNTSSRSGGSRSGNGRPASGRSTSGKSAKSNTSSRGRSRAPEPEPDILQGDLFLLLSVAVCIVLFLCNFGIIGIFGDTLSSIMFGLFGLVSWMLPLVSIVFILFAVFNRGNARATRKLIAGAVLCVLIMIMCDMATGEINTDLQIDIPGIYSRCSENRRGGGVLGGIPAFFLEKTLGGVGTILFLAVLGIICVIVIAGKSLLTGLKEQGQLMYDETMEERRTRNLSREEASRIRQAERAERIARKREMNDAREREKQMRAEEKENEQILRMEKKGVGVTFNTTLDKNLNELSNNSEIRDDEHLIKVTDNDEYERCTSNSAVLHDSMTAEGSDALREITPVYDDEPGEYETEEPYDEPVPKAPEDSYATEYGNTMGHTSSAARPAAVRRQDKPAAPVTPEPGQAPVSRKKNASQAGYKFPPISLLTPGSGGRRSGGDKELKETSDRLIQTLETFGVKARITDVSRGPAVTRYELQPELGVKVSKIVGLSDDLKLALAATDIRIEAPIPGKSAVGIEVPNKENEAVAFRDLIESQNFKNSTASLPFAVGKDIGGQIVIHDIAKMPHVLIAGATGSGKSVCINTIIMSILYKCRPEDVRLIMIDPKVVELSVYNDVPHLLLPVVTDPKKAAGALQWAVKEMTDRYAKFAEASVRDLKGYNAQTEDPSEKLPHILIIVDELADLMMVAPGEVEESICRLAQLARACGIHLVIATQRPSVDVITGLIKANMPSRIAFAVSSGVDSRTILDMVGAEKLLGKGDMLFYPQGLPKPTRVQGAFVPDSDVSKVSHFFKELGYVPGGDSDISDQVSSISVSSPGSAAASDAGESEYDDYFAQAGRFIIDKDKASIGALQRLLKIGFNRAARIMDQLADAGVVGEEQGTKPREILMNEVQFEDLLESLGLE